MKTSKMTLSLLIAALISIVSLQSTKAQEKNVYFWDFEDVPVGQLPEGWKSDVTNLKGEKSIWKVIIDKTASSGKKVLGMVDPKDSYGSSFNVCWTDKVSFKNGEIEVKFKAVKGREDQGGGIMWRVQDKNNYYVARFNPLEDNFRIYFVKNSHRRMIKSARVSLPSGKWHTMKVIQDGNRFKCYLNGKLYLSGKDNHFKKAGGVGVWTKADAVTYFDDFKVEIK